MATAAVGVKGMPKIDCVAKRSNALPKASLFGSALEIHDAESARNLSNIDPANYSLPRTPFGGVKGTGQRYMLPDDIKKTLPGAQVVENSRQTFDTQRNVVNELTGSLKQREEGALYKFSGLEGGQHPAGSETSRSQWFTQKDLKGARDINTVGLNKNQSYNRDKYGPKPPVHNYSLIGDILRPGMDLPRRERTEIQMRNMGYGKGDLRGALVEGHKPQTQSGSQTARAPPRKPLDLPANIKHQFGSRVCDKLLADKEKVAETIKRQQEMKESRQSSKKPVAESKLGTEICPEYEMLGNALRMNVVPGYTLNHKISTTKTSFNDQVHLFRYPDPDKWRYQKDELSTWTEQQFLYKRLLASWKQYVNEKPTFKKNWTVKSRPKTVPLQNEPLKRPVPKAKTATVKREKKEVTSKMEDFVFESPPVTPPPPKPLPPKEVKPDKEFWGFYDNSRP